MVSQRNVIAEHKKTSRRKPDGMFFVQRFLNEFVYPG